MSRTLIALAILATAAPAAASNPWASLHATITVENAAGFPVPADYGAHRAIAIYDTNHDGVVGGPGDPSRPFPFGENHAATLHGRHIGSPHVVTTTGAIPPAGFCGDVLVYSEMDDPQDPARIFFLWAAFKSQYYQATFGDYCEEGRAMDFGIGHYRTDSTVHRHATLVGGSLRAATGHDAFRIVLTQPGGTPASPGHVFSAPLADGWDAWPQSIGYAVAADAGIAPGFDVPRIAANQLRIDVPLIGEEHWDGQSTFGAHSQFARTIQGLTASSSHGAPNAASDGATRLVGQEAPGALDQPLEYGSLRFADVNGDSRDDVCFLRQSDLACRFSTPGGTWSAPVSASLDFSLSALGGADKAGTLRFPDVNGDGRADVCARAAWGVKCALSQGGAFGPAGVWSWSFADWNGWGQAAYYWATIRFPDVDGDGRADVCARGGAGIYCGLSNGANAFVGLGLWASEFSNASSWHTGSSYYETLQYADLDGDGRDDVCGRGSAGVWCARSLGGGFEPATLWSDNFRNAWGWSQPQYYRTIQLGDINGDGQADLCGRGGAGVLCALSLGGRFSGVALQVPAFSDANGWNAARYYESITLMDVDGDQDADICGRGSAGIYCAIAESNAWGSVYFAAATRVSPAFSDASVGGNPAYWSTLQAAQADTDPGLALCASTPDGVRCSF